jgi:ribosomal protein L11 methyltransferase
MTSTWAYRTEVDLEAANVHLPALEDAGLLGIVEAAGVATLHFHERVPDLPLPGEWEEVPAQDWHARWRESVRPVRVGGMTIAPPWLAEPGPDVLVIEPAQAFGTGHHETTTGCLAALLELDLTGRRVLDVGTGTGVLAIAAARLGAGAVVACDTDPLAVEATAENAGINGVDVQVHLGSLAQLPSGAYDVVVANLDTATLSRLAGDLVDRIADRGWLVASGVSRERQDEAVAAFEAAGLPVHARAGREWVVLTARRG